MRMAFARQGLGVLALIASSVGSAATLAVTPATYAPLLLGQTIALSVDASGFVNDIGGITLTLSYDSSVLSLISAVLPAAGPLRAATGAFLVNNNPTFDWLPGSEIPTGSFAMGIFTFQSIGSGVSTVAFSDDGGIATGWFDANTADYIGGTTYSNATPPTCLSCPPPPPIPEIPAPPAVWLLGTAVAAIGGRQWMRRKGR